MQNKNIQSIEIKVVEQDGTKYYEAVDKMIVSVSDYGVEVIKGSQIASYANIPVSFKVDPNKDYWMLKGYLNNKLIPGTEQVARDSYGDVPTGASVYDCSRLMNNPVALCDHYNSSSGIAGNWIYLMENAQGLQFREILRPLDEIYVDSTKDTVSAWMMGWGKAFSIGGRWLYDYEQSDPSTNTFILVKAILHETSHVAVGADQWALSCAPDRVKVHKGDVSIPQTLEEMIKLYLGTGDKSYIDQIEKLKRESV